MKRMVGKFPVKADMFIAIYQVAAQPAEDYHCHLNFSDSRKTKDLKISK
ncbi:hypothetical protein SAMN05216288_2059 [Pseudomonas punonensis]|uniref:Uncharacterized protein n=1 Tax=Phytopseudomonas punonensis TaxID=1220495 RepID=A0A1M7C7K6_9GAMM|nr:hypothetical protein SAMN05216288_2059 [Pseudomonas punonensis]